MIETDEFKAYMTSRDAMSFYKTKAASYSGVTSEMIAKMFAVQDGECALCGDELTFGTRETHLDHINPKAKGGDNDFDNLQLVCAPCNYAKRDLTMYDFVLMCLKVENKFHKTDYLPKEVIQEIVQRRWRREGREKKKEA